MASVEILVSIGDIQEVAIEGVESLIPHTFMKITGDNGQITTVGFSPEIVGIYGTGKISDNSGHTYDSSSGILNITPDQYNALMGYVQISIANPPFYDILGGQQCASWDVDGLRVAGIIPPAISPQGVPVYDTLIWNPYSQYLGFEIASGLDALISFRQPTITSGIGGNDVLYGDSGNNHLIGGQGDDSLHGNNGEDSYYFSAGDGHDYVYDEWESSFWELGQGSANLIKINANYSDLPSGLILSHNEQGDLIIKYTETDSITLKGYYKTSELGDALTLIEQAPFKIKFLDHIIDSGVLFNLGKYMYGTTVAETITGLTAYANVIYGGNGADKLVGGKLADVLYGTDEDTSYSDLLLGGNGNDAYYLNNGDLFTHTFNKGARLVAKFPEEAQMWNYFQRKIIPAYVPRDKHLSWISRYGRIESAIKSGYSWRSTVESMFNVLKSITGDKLASRRISSQILESQQRCWILNAINVA